MMKVTGSKLLNLQVLRFLAAALVVLAHAIDLTQPLTSPSYLADGRFSNFGAVGVDIFFVISGFIIVKSGFLDRRMNPLTFLWHRLRRVAPIYYLLSLPWIVLLLPGNLSFGALISTFLFWPAITHSLRMPVLTVGWTLWFEMLFYVGATLVLATRGRWMIAVLAGVFAACWALRIGTNSPVFQFMGNPMIIEFGFGVMIALWAHRLNFGISLALGLVGTAWLAGSILVGFGEISEVDRTITGELALQRVLVWGIPSAMIVAAAIGLPSRDNALSRPLVFLGDASYSIYLSHKLVFLCLEPVIVDGIMPKDFLIVACTGLALLVGCATYQWLEKPLIGLIKRKRQTGNLLA